MSSEAGGPRFACTEELLAALAHATARGPERAPLVEDTWAEELVGAWLGSFRIHEVLGVGGMGAVFRAQDMALSREVAIKVIRPDLRGRARILDEARAAASVQHPYIARVYGVGAHNDVDFVVMEYVPGKSLRARLTEGPFGDLEAAGILERLAEALAGCHAQGLVHRDLHPGNIMLAADGGLKLLDFGLSTQPGSRPALDGGTRGYADPERTAGGASDPREDVYAFGVVGKEVLARRRRRGWLARAFKGGRKRGWRRVLTACLGPRSKRPADGDALVGALTRAAWVRVRNNATLVVAAGACIGVAIGGVVLLGKVAAPAVPDTPIVRVTSHPADGPARHVALSPGGDRLAVVAGEALTVVDLTLERSVDVPLPGGVAARVEAVAWRQGGGVTLTCGTPDGTASEVRVVAPGTQVVGPPQPVIPQPLPPSASAGQGDGASSGANRRLALAPADRQLGWAQGGALILRPEPDGTGDNLWWLPPGSSEQARRLTRWEGFSIGAASLSGHRLAFVRREAEADVWTGRLAGGRLEAVRPLVASQLDERAGAWDAGGLHLAVTEQWLGRPATRWVRRDGVGVGPRDTEALWPVSRGDGRYAWSPDGDRAARLTWAPGDGAAPRDVEPAVTRSLLGEDGAGVRCGSHAGACVVSAPEGAGVVFRQLDGVRLGEVLLRRPTRVASWSLDPPAEAITLVERGGLWAWRSGRAALESVALPAGCRADRVAGPRGGAPVIVGARCADGAHLMALGPAGAVSIYGAGTGTQLGEIALSGDGAAVAWTRLAQRGDVWLADLTAALGAVAGERR